MLPPLLRTPRAVRRLLLLLLTLLGAGVLFYNYGSGVFSRWDEGLYGQFARNALTHGDYLLPLDPSGDYSKEPFSKPPLSFLIVALSFELASPSIQSLRFPFTLGMFLLVLTCAAWGNDIARRLRLGPWLGFTWGLFALLTQAAMQWGRYAVIENVFVLFLVLALWLHARALTRSWPWALLAGLALCLAFLTKQLAIGLALLPMGVLELLHLREQGGVRRMLARGLSWATPPALVALGWAVLAYEREGKRFSNMLWEFALVQRFKGYQGTVHFNTFNRVSGELAASLYPFSWLLGALGLCLLTGCVLARRGSGRGRYAELSPVLFFLTAVLVLENATKSLLPWYVLSFMPPVTLGLAWLVVQGQRTLRVWWRRDAYRPSPRAVAYVALGAVVLYLALGDAARLFMSQMNLAVLLLGGGLAFVWWLAPRRRRARSAPGALFTGALAALTLSHFRHVEYRQSPGTLETLMGVVGEAGVERPLVSKAVNKSDVERYEPVTLFGSHVRAGAAPWLEGPRHPVDGFVDFVVLPEEAHARHPERLRRAPGATLFVGDLSQDPFPEAEVRELLEQGPLTFEAEWMGTGRATSLVRDRAASGGRARRYKPWLSEGVKSHNVSQAATWPLPAGDYVAEVWVRWRCGKQKGAEVGVVKVGGRQRKLSCKTPDHLDGYRPIPVRFSSPKAQAIKLSVQFERGRGELWHDRTLVYRADVYEALRTNEKP